MRSSIVAAALLLVACETFPAGDGACARDETDLPLGAACCPANRSPCGVGLACVSASDGSEGTCRAGRDEPCANDADCRSLRCVGGRCGPPCDLGGGTGPCAVEAHSSACSSCSHEAIRRVPGAPVRCWLDSGIDCFAPELSCMERFCVEELCAWWAEVQEVAPETPACL